MMRKHLIAATLISLIAFSGCIQEEKQPLVLIHQTWIGDGPIYIAKEKGFLEKQGVDVEILRVEGAAERRSLLASGRADISLETIDMSIVDIGIGAPQVMVLKLDESLGADGIIATEEIKSISDLEGKKVGCAIGDPPYFLLRILMEEHNVSKEKIEFLDIPADVAGAAFVAGDIDAACTWEPWLSKATEREGGHLLVSSADAPGTIVDVMVVNPKTLENRREDVKALMRAWLESYEYIQEYPEESYEIMGRAFDLSGEEFEEFTEGVKWNDLEENKAFFESGIFKIANEINEIALQDGMIKEKIDVQSAIDASLVMELQE